MDRDACREYFERYAAASLQSDPGKLADFYDQSFLAAGPSGGAAFRVAAYISHEDQEEAMRANGLL